MQFNLHASKGLPSPKQTANHEPLCCSPSCSDFHRVMELSQNKPVQRRGNSCWANTTSSHFWVTKGIECHQHACEMVTDVSRRSANKQTGTYNSKRNFPAAVQHDILFWRSKLADIICYLQYESVCVKQYKNLSVRTYIVFCIRALTNFLKVLVINCFPSKYENPTLCSY